MEPFTYILLILLFYCDHTTFLPHYFNVWTLTSNVIIFMEYLNIHYVISSGLCGTQKIVSALVELRKILKTFSQGVKHLQ